MDVAYLLVESRSFGVGDVIRIHVLENVLLVSSFERRFDTRRNAHDEDLSEGVTEIGAICRTQQTGESE